MRPAERRGSGDAQGCFERRKETGGVLALILAAGASTRMGQPKALLRFGSKTALECIRKSLRAAGVTWHRVVLGRDEAAVRRGTPLDGAEVVTNPAPDRGRTSSIQVGVEGVLPDYGVLIWPVDQPLVRCETVVAVLESFRPRGVVIPTHDGRGGHPILVASTIAPEIGVLEPDAPLRSWVRRKPITFVPVGDPYVHVDIDTPEEYARHAKAT